MKLRTLGLMALPLLFAGCQTVSDVIPINEDTYAVVAEIRGGMASDEEVTALGVRKANDWCAAQNKQMKILVYTNSGPKVRTPPQSLVGFTCVDKN